MEDSMSNFRFLFLHTRWYMFWLTLFFAGIMGLHSTWWIRVGDGVFFLLVVVAFWLEENKTQAWGWYRAKLPVSYYPYDNVEKAALEEWAAGVLKASTANYVQAYLSLNRKEKELRDLEAEKVTTNKSLQDFRKQRDALTAEVAKLKDKKLQTDNILSARWKVICKLDIPMPAALKNEFVKGVEHEMLSLRTAE
jgi:hypothetical protein